MSHLLKYILPVALSGFVIDRVSKIWIVDVIGLPVLGSVDVIPPYLNFRMAWNTGINFGLGSNGPEMTRWILIALAVVICVGLMWWVLRQGRRELSLAAGLVIGGALGNAWDRFQWGAVADFLNNSCCGFDNPFSYNLADVFVFAGAIRIAVRS